jgi:hypothetical protein
MTGMRLALATIGLALALTGCTTEAEPIPAAIPAGPQFAEVGWDEPFPAKAPRLVFRVASFAVTEDGWKAAVEIANETNITWRIGAEGSSAGQQFGVMLFATDSLDEVEERNRDASLPAIRRATAYEPPPPATLAPSTTWSGTISARGALASGRFVRVTFGLLTAVGTPPEGVPEQVLWITDSAYELLRR